MTDLADQGIAPTFDRAFDNILPMEGGHKYWPELFVAEPLGFGSLTMSLAVPAGDGPHPLVVFIHGGGWQSGHQNVGNPIFVRMRITENLLAAGYAIARASYRLPGEGQFPIQLHDLKSAVRFLRHHAPRFTLDTSRFAAMTESAGGHLALLLGLVNGDPDLEGAVGVTGPSSAVRCLVNWYGVTEFMSMNEQSQPDTGIDHNASNSLPADLLGGPIPANIALAERASPTTYVTPNAIPILSQHGTRDMIVPFGQAEVMHSKMIAAGAHHEPHPINGADHCFWHGDETNVMPRAIKFLRDHC